MCPTAPWLYRWLQRAVAQGVLCRDGEGKKRRPFRFWLKEREQHWLKDPMALLHMPELIEEYTAAQSRLEQTS